MKPSDKKRFSFRGHIAALLMRLLGKKPPITPESVEKMEFSSSTQRMGIRFSDKLRNAFRHRWLRIHRR